MWHEAKCKKVCITDDEFMVKKHISVKRIFGPPDKNVCGIYEVRVRCLEK
jgi:hypothetical protein